MRRIRRERKIKNKPVQVQSGSGNTAYSLKRNTLPIHTGLAPTTKKNTGLAPSSWDFLQALRDAIN
jgi:hypothetical protein